MKKNFLLMKRSRMFFGWLLLAGIVCQAQLVLAQAVPYARTYARSKEDVDGALKELQAYAGQKLPIVDGFVAMGAEPLDRYERAFYQFSIDILPATPGSCVVRLSAKITAWYADKDPAKSGYRVLPSNGRLELDLLDRLTEKFGGKTAGIASPSSSLQMPRPKLDVASGLPVNSGGRTGSAGGTMAGGETIEEMAILKLKRETEEKHAQQLNAELQNFLELERNQAHPQNLVVVKKSGTPVLARAAAGSKVLFQAAADDEFEFIDADEEWIHVQISGASRGYLRRNMVELPEILARRLKPTGEAKKVLFRVTREETGVFPGNWEKLKGKTVKIFTVQPAADGKKTEAAEKVAFAESIFERFGKDGGEAISTLEGAVIIFDSADGGIIAATLGDVKERAGGSLPREEFLKRSYMDPVSAFNPSVEK
ncbi:MAG TPA: hypothetical protein VN982_00535 [Candidatus Dormibacteraeota bacterium]|nr:hypothetical protein [Candidatus Dormibacteraeota bacterium]